MKKSRIQNFKIKNNSMIKSRFFILCLLAIQCIGMSAQNSSQEEIKIKKDQKLSKKDLEKIASVKDIMQKVVTWQMDPKNAGELTADWTYGALYIGVVEYAKSTNDTIAFNWLKKVGDKLRWAQHLQVNPFMRYHADDYAVGMMYAEMYRLFKDKNMYIPMENYCDFILMYPSTRNLKRNMDPHSLPFERWSWCDALFMAPPVWAKMANITGKKEYLEFMDKEYRYTYDHLYDKKEHLFYRDERFLTKKEANGQPIFWGRGNGWVLAGLPLIIDEFPADFKNKKFYEDLFVEMATRIAGLQGKDGYWHASLLDPDSYPNPETSCTGFYTYALAWGVNKGYLNKKKFLPVIKKGWEALTNAVNPDGKLCWVQPIGADPKKVEREMTAVYGVGAFLMAGTEMEKLEAKH